MPHRVKRALISVFDKTNIVEFAQALANLDIEILSTGGTARLLNASGIVVTQVSEHTGFPEMMGGRIKTLHPVIHGGILGRRGEDEAIMNRHGIQPIDLVVVNLYPFKQTVSNPECTLADAIESIDIGGPAMLRAAAKNHKNVGAIVSSDDYDRVIEQLKNNHGNLHDDLRFALAVRAFEHSANYDGMIANYLGKQARDDINFPSTFNLQLNLKQQMRYGENPHQKGVFYSESETQNGTVAFAKQIQGKQLSYNNIADTDAALECVKQFSDAPTCVIVKHGNPCGVAQSDSLMQAYQRAYTTDPESAFGGIIALNRDLDANCARSIVDKQFVEVIIAPNVEKPALAVLADKGNIRVLTTSGWENNYDPEQSLNPRSPPALDYKKVSGGLLVQEKDCRLYAELVVVTARSPSDAEMQDLLFAWKVAKYVKSNAIIYASAGMTIGIGAGQMSRVNSARIAAIKAKHAGLNLPGSVMASDAFFPFRDGLDSAGAAGITAVIQPGGALRDDEVIAAANEHNIAMIFTGMRHFRH